MALSAPLSKEELRGYMHLPESDRRELWSSVDEFASHALALKHRDPVCPSSRETGKFAFRFDASDRNVPAEPYRDRDAPWVWWFAVSSRAPLVTCQTFVVGAIVDAGEMRPGTHYSPEEPPRAQAVEWTRRIASAFDLRYVEAKKLREWAINYDEVDPEFEFALQHQPYDPNAFQVLFLEI